MKLLMITRKIDYDDAVAGHSYHWAKAIARHVDRLYVICLGKGNTAGLPENVEVHSTGKERGVPRLLRWWRFWRLSRKLVPLVDGIFCHQNPEYTIGVAPLAKRYHKRIVSWYVHGSVTAKTRQMERLADVVLTANEKSFRMKSDKVKIMGHGIDTELFSPGESRQHAGYRIFSAGRISPTKNYETLIAAVRELRASGLNNVTLTIAGEPAKPADRSYLARLRTMVEKEKLEGMVTFIGAVPYHKIPEHLRQSDLFVNLSGTGSVDKAVLEAMSCGVIPLTSNEAFERILPSDLLVSKNDPKSLAQAISSTLHRQQDALSELRKKLRSEVIEHHNLNNLVTRIIEQYGTAS